jgi:hypothetical protein
MEVHFLKLPFKKGITFFFSCMYIYLFVLLCTFVLKVHLLSTTPLQFVYNQNQCKVRNKVCNFEERSLRRRSSPTKFVTTVMFILMS